MKIQILALGFLTVGSVALANQKVDRVGYLEYNGRCPNYGIALHDNPNEENPSGTCVVFPALEHLKTIQDAKRAAFAALVDIKVRVTGTLAQDAVINAVSITAQ